MLVNRKNIIAATLKVNGMSSDQQQEIILSLLDTNPTQGLGGRWHPQELRWQVVPLGSVRRQLA
jgi:hypothetical protein